MGALAGRLGRHRAGLAGAAGLIAAAAALALPAPASSAPLVRWQVAGGLAPRDSSIVVHRDRTARVDNVREVTLGGREFRRLKDRLAAARFKTLKQSYEPDVIVFDGITQTVRHRGRSVSVSTGAQDVPRRLSRLLRVLGRIHDRHDAPPETNPK
jgi:hypothetical protein